MSGLFLSSFLLIKFAEAMMFLLHDDHQRELGVDVF